MTCHRAMCRFGFHRFAIGRQQHGCHQAERAKALRYRIGLHIAIIIFTGPDKFAVPFQRGGDHIVNQTVLIIDAQSLEFFLKLGIKDFLKQIFKTPVIGFHNGVFGR